MQKKKISETIGLLEECCDADDTPISGMLNVIDLLTSFFFILYERILLNVYIYMYYVQIFKTLTTV